jgi:hypothetical protein
MADYYSLISRAVDNLPRTATPAMRQAIYDRGRNALVSQLEAVRPPLPKRDIARELEAFTAAVLDVEARVGISNASRDHSTRSSWPQPRPPSPLPQPTSSNPRPPSAPPRQPSPLPPMPSTPPQQSSPSPPPAKKAVPPAQSKNTQSSRVINPLKVFMSYSHDDARMHKRLGHHLSPLVDQGLIRIWHDRAIEPAADWEGEINHEIQQADIVLVLVSASYLNSRYCTRELRRALDLRSNGKSRVVPIILRPCDWENVFNRSDYKAQALPRDNRPIASAAWSNHDTAYATVAREFRKMVERMLDAGQEA